MFKFAIRSAGGRNATDDGEHRRRTQRGFGEMKPTPPHGASHLRAHDAMQKGASGTRPPEGKTGRTLLSTAQYKAALPTALQYISRHGHVTNSVLRQLTSLNYDQVIKFFNRAVEEKVLIRQGRTGGTHYVRPTDRIV